MVNYLVNYYILSPWKDSPSWAYGHKQTYTLLKSMESNADTIIFTGHYWKPYIFYLYFNKIDPHYYQTHQNQNNIANYHFFSTYWDGGSDIKETDLENFKRGRTVVVLSPQEYQALQNKKKFSLIETVNDYSGLNSLFLVGRWQ